jgi:glucokinase
MSIFIPAKKGLFMTLFDEKIIGCQIDDKKPLLLVADIGGTNSTFGVYQEQGDELQLLLILHTQSKMITDFTTVVTAVVDEVFKKFKKQIDRICIAAAGMISEDRDYVALTNRTFAIDIQAIKKATKVPMVLLANDFEVINYGIELVAPKDLVVINKGHARHFANRAIVGAGTGLGKSLLYWSQATERYESLPSEGGHADCSVQNQLELDLITFIHQKENRTDTISWEDLLSGYGIQRIYHFFKHRNNQVKSCKRLGEDGPHPDEIFKSRNLDEYAHETYQLYTKLYARCIKNVAFETLALGGIYITGGIAIHNVQLFQDPLFLQEFVDGGKLEDILRQVPLTVIADYYVSIYGAARFMQLKTKKERPDDSPVSLNKINN